LYCDDITFLNIKERRGQNALDDLRSSSRIVAARHGEFLYARGPHPHSIGACGDRFADPLIPGAQARFVVGFGSGGTNRK
jgi:hypothetical protein